MYLSSLSNGLNFIITEKKEFNSFFHIFLLVPELIKLTGKSVSFLIVLERHLFYGLSTYLFWP